jgi:periplasmic divalent cation tolerance protein
MADARVYVVLITAPPDKAVEIARTLVESRLAACVNIVERVRSVYWWEGRVTEDAEALLIVKTSRGALADLIGKVREIHPYKVPEVIALPVEAGLDDYLEWVESEVRASGRSGGA